MVTGSEGFVGKHVSNKLESRGYSLIKIDKKINSSVEDVSISTLRKVDAVVHLANTARIPKSWQDPSKYFENNVNNSVELFRKAQDAGVKQFIYISSSSVYGSSLLDRLNEQTYCKPINPYAISKLATEQCLQAFESINAVTNLVIVRPFTLYGPGQPLKENSLVIGKFINCVLNNQPLSIEGSGLQKRDFLHVDDFAEAMLYLIDKRDTLRIYNVGSGESVSIKQIAEWFDHPVVHVEPRLGRDYDTCADIDKMNKLGWKPTVKLQDWINMLKSNNFKEFK